MCIRDRFIDESGIKSLVFIDESGCKDNQDCIYAWSKKGKKVYGEPERKRGKRENLVAGRRKKRKSFNSANYIQRKSKCRGI